MTNSLYGLMAVTPAEQADQFVGNPDNYGAMGIYGGHFLGQALAAGFETVDEPKLAQSLHANFLAPGDPEAPILYSIARLREGRGSDVRTITASQHGRPVFFMTASFKLAEDGDTHQPDMPQVSDAETLLAQQGAIPFEPPPMRDGRAEMVFVSDHFIQPEFKPGRSPELCLWTRCPGDAPANPRQHQIALAYLSDGTLMFNSVLPHGLPFQTHRLTTIDHSAWFHHVPDVTGWMLFDQRSTAAADGRGMNHGHLFSADGQLLMSTTQESMLRRIPGV